VGVFNVSYFKTFPDNFSDIEDTSPFRNGRKKGVVGRREKERKDKHLPSFLCIVLFLWEVLISPVSQLPE
jgi:hypothetical protein